MTKKINIIMPTEEEDAAITAAALSDPDAQPLTDSELAQFKPTRNRGRPTQAVTKVPTSVRLDPAVLDAFKRTGPGWQTRINQALLEYASSHEMFEREYSALRRPQVNFKMDEAVYGAGMFVHTDVHVQSLANTVSAYLMSSVGESWLYSQRSLPWEQKHPIAKWESILIEQQTSVDPAAEKDNFTGAFAAWVFLGYHLYLIHEHSQLQAELVARLKNDLCFQGARFEITVAATMLAAGFDIELANENGHGRRPDFIATFPTTKQQFAVEVKSKHRPGILCTGPDPRVKEPKHADIGSLLLKAVKNNDQLLPLLLFVEVNLPFGVPGESSQIALELDRSFQDLDRSVSPEKGLPFAGVFFYNDRAPWMLKRTMPEAEDQCWVIGKISTHTHKFDAMPYLHRISGAFAKALRIPKKTSDVKLIGNTY